MSEFFLEPFQYAFMQRGLIAAVMVGIVCATVGVYVVLRGMAFFGNALAHTILPGVAAGYLVSGTSGTALFWWALVTAILSSFGISAMTQSGRMREDTAIGIIFAGMFALGIALISSVRSYSTDLTHFLFGNVLGVSAGDLWLTAIFGLVILLVIFLFYKEFMVLSFDPVLAKTLRLPTRFLNHLLLVLIALAIVVSLQTVGVALMVAMLVTPAATAQLVTQRLWKMMLISAAIAVLSGVLGLFISFYVSIASGAAIVLIATLIFILTLGFQRLRESFS
ncbi:MAG TPA: metal ABC transporter permease [Candidatus Marinimicrobia bacterium]|mgnify:CR=1 FL=1|nr:metal ABC transporter permease [Candidatus Neomarinimicrobiota bacterium]